MKIFNIIMNRKLGGAEQAFLDYHKALILQNHQVINITSSRAKVNRFASSIKLPNLFPWCVISKLYLKFLIFWLKPDIIIAHGGRAVNFSCSFSRNTTPVIGVTHSYSVKHILKCDYIIALDEHLKKRMVRHGFRESKIFIIPNMISLPSENDVVDSTTAPRNNDLFTIGALGRFVPEKGFDYLIRAIRILRNQNYNVKLKLAGDGYLKETLLKLVHDLDLQQDVEFTGWIHDKGTFYNKIDVLCIPSTFETFGIVALEGMSRGVPVVATKTGGLEHIFTHGIDGLVAETSSTEELAEYIGLLLGDKKMAKKLTDAAYQKIIDKYEIHKVAGELSRVIENIVKQPAP